MRITAIHIQHYKSLADVQIELSPVTVLVGPNGSGKSNVVDALRFLREAVVHGLDHAISERGGIDISRQYSPTRPYTISMDIKFEYSSFVADQAYPGHYAFKVSGSGGNHHVESEEATWINEDGHFDENRDDWVIDSVSKNSLKRGKSGTVTFLSDSSSVPQKKLEVPSDQLAIGSISYFRKFGGDIVYASLASMRFASIYPNILRAPSRPDTDKQLKEDCVNWASVLKAMRQRKAGVKMLARINELMKQVMPALEHVTVKQIGGYIVPQFLVKDTPNEKAHFFDPVQLSDGTLRLFGIFLSLYQLPRPDFLALEEPELTIHPGLVNLLAEAFQEVSGRTQLLITTHSPYLLDHFDPSQIKVVTMQDGETKVSSIRRSQVKTVKEKLMMLSEVMALDGLRPD